MTGSPILSLDETVGELSEAERDGFQRIYAITPAVGELRIPDGMQPWVEQQFGSVEAVSRQKIIRVTNKLTGEETVFSMLRASRPLDSRAVGVELAHARAADLFRNPQESTPEDDFGRVVGKHCITASNIAKFDGLHSLIIFNDFDPLHFSREQVIDYISVAWEWAKKAHATQPPAKYFALIWNCLWRAGASIVHGHAQVMLTTGRHYARIDRLRQAAVSYRQVYGADYFAGLFQAHRAVGCAVAEGEVTVLAYITPFKDREVVLMAEELSPALKERVYEMLAFFRDRLGATSFNLSLVTPPLAETEEDWGGFPVIIRLLDRGNPEHRASDVGGMEIYAASVVSSDPMELARGLRQYLKEQSHG